VREAGLGLARLTVERPAEAGARLGLIRRAIDLQHALGWLKSFAPLPRAWSASAPTTGYEDVRQIALARLLCDNIPSIQVDWALYGPKLAQVALTVGADDLDAVSAVDDDSEGRRRSPLEEVRRNIEAAALEPVERDGAYGRIG
jgi:aminodeoxyfutalosine synthase